MKYYNHITKKKKLFEGLQRQPRQKKNPALSPVYLYSRQFFSIVSVYYDPTILIRLCDVQLGSHLQIFWLTISSYDPT